MAVLALAFFAGAGVSNAGETAVNPAVLAHAREIQDATGVKGGLIVHVGCGDGTLTAALRTSDGFIVHGLDTDAANIAAARQHIQSLGLYGPVSVETWSGKRLPYADNLVNLVVSAANHRLAATKSCACWLPAAWRFPSIPGPRSPLPDG